VEPALERIILEHIMLVQKRITKNYFRHSLKPANESIFWFNVLLESDLVPDKTKPNCAWLLKEAKELSKIFASSVLTMKKKKV